MTRGLGKAPGVSEALSDNDRCSANKHLSRLAEILSAHSPLAVAISGGVDSTTLACVAHRVLGDNVSMVHAISPAVPEEATLRVQQYASRFGWNLLQVNAGEFEDTQYRDNPVNRCYYCKSNLYSRIRQVWCNTIASGANLDDLGDYRPGLLAAREKKVIHPLIEADINKQGVRLMANLLDLSDVADLPAQPCLSSRIETGIAIDADDLQFVHRIETMLASHLGIGDIRCRITAAGVRIEVPEALVRADRQRWQEAQASVEQATADSGRRIIGYSSYKRGSAFLHGQSDISIPVAEVRINTSRDNGY